MGGYSLAARSLLEALLRGGDVYSLCVEVMSMQIRQVGWQLWKKIAEVEANGNEPCDIDGPERFGLLDFVTDRALFNIQGTSPVQVEDKICMTMTEPGGYLVAGLLGQVSDETAAAVLNRLCNSLAVPAMLALGGMYQVPEGRYIYTFDNEGEGPRDFRLVGRHGLELSCELRLTGGGRFDPISKPLSDDSNIVIVDSLTESVERQIHFHRKHWVELGAPDGYKRMHTVFSYLDIPCVNFSGDLDSALDSIIPAVFEEITQ